MAPDMRNPKSEAPNTELRSAKFDNFCCARKGMGLFGKGESDILPAVVRDARDSLPALQGLLVGVTLGVLCGGASASLAAAAAVAICLALLAGSHRPLLVGGRHAPLPTVPVEGWPVEVEQPDKRTLRGGDDSSPLSPTVDGPATSLVFSVNGKEQRITSPSPSMLLSDFLRDELGLTGTKVGCGEGGCGACTVVAVGADDVPRSINACLRLLCACDGLAITTVEGFGSSDQVFSAVQRAIAEGQGSQCGFCTPGWVTAMSALLARHAKSGEPLTASAIEHSLDGNLCRCTGYRPILQAFKTAFAVDAAPAGACCGAGRKGEGEGEGEGEAPSCDIEALGETACHDVRSGAACDRECDAAAAAAAAAAASARPRGAAAGARRLRFEDSAASLAYVRPTSLAELQQVLHAAGPAARIVAGNTGMGVAKYYAPGGPTGTGGSKGGAAGQPPELDATTVDVSAVAELVAPAAYSATTGVLTAGAAVTLEAVRAALDRVAAAPATAGTSAAPVASELSRHLGRVATTQVRAVGSWAGNLCLAAAAPALPSDVLLILAAAGATVELLPRGALPSAAAQPRSTPVETFVAGGAAAVAANVVVSLRLPLRGAPSVLGRFSCSSAASPGAGQVTRAYADKTSQRHANSHAIVNAALVATTDAEGGVTSCKAVFGGVIDSGLFVATVAPQALLGKRLTDATALQGFVSALETEAKQRGLSTDPQNSASYRLALLRSFAYKFFLRAQPSLPPALSSAVAASLAAVEDRPVSSGVQSIAVSDSSLAPVSQPMPKLTSLLQASGEARYTSDAPRQHRELCGAFVCTAVGADHGATLAGADFSACLGMPGVVDIVLAADVPVAAANDDAANDTQTFPKYLVRVGDAVPAVGARVALVLADTLAHARCGAKAANLTYKTIETAPGGPRRATQEHFAGAVAHMQATGHARRAGLRLRALAEATEEAVRKLAGRDKEPSAEARAEAEAALDAHWQVVAGRTPAEWRTAAKQATGATVLSGEVSLGGQKHFYLETHTAYAEPQEDGKIVVTCANQNPSLTQQAIAGALGVPVSHVDVVVRRVGGAYGGKLNAHLPTAVLAAVAAVKHRRPVRLHNERADDMSATGGRASMEGSWSLAVDATSGVVSSVELSFVFDSGCTDGAGGGGDLGMATQWSDNCYRHADFKAGGKIVLTTRPGNTSCRAPGVIQGILLHELALEHAAEACSMPAEELREKNLYAVGDKAPMGVVIGEGGYNWNVPAMWARAKSEWQVAERRKAAATFNAANVWRKRGLCMMPIKYGIGYEAADFHESASVRIFGADGSVRVAHGGCELGQGIHTKVAQAVAYALGCPLDAVVVGDTSSTGGASGSLATGGSATSELCVSAVLDACSTLDAQLAPHRDTGGDWAATVTAAAKANLSLAAVGWFGGDGTGGSHGSGTRWEYATQGVGCVEVEVDVLTGELSIARADLLMDQGTPLSPLVDLGQVEGGFVMALGLLTTEEVQYAADGTQRNLGTWQYKPPAVHDIPLQLNVAFLENAPNPKSNAVLRSKASAEPPMALGGAAFLAARDAIRAARADAGGAGAAPFRLDAPLTPEKVQLACLVNADRFVLQ